MGRRKFSDMELGDAIRAGKSVPEIAKEFNVAPRSVYKRCAKLKLIATKEIIAHQSAQVVKKDMDASQQLLKVNQSTMELLDTFIEIVRSEGEEQEVLIDKVRILLGDKQSMLDALLALKREHRQQLQLMMDIWKTKYDVEVAQEFMNSVLRIIEQIDPATRNKIVVQLQQFCQVRLGISWDLKPY